MKKIIVTICFFMLCFLFFSQKVSAAEENIAFQELGLEKAMESVKEMNLYEGADWEKLFQHILSGDILGALTELFRSVKNSLLGDTTYLKNTFVKLMIFAIAAGVFGALSTAFGGKETLQMGSFMMNALLFTVLIGMFTICITITKKALSTVSIIQNTMLPVYYAAVALSGHSITAFSHYRITLVILYITENLLTLIVLPLISCFVLLSLANGIWQEGDLSPLTDFMKRVIRFILKTSIGVISGLSILQSMVSPSIDGLKLGGIQKSVGMLPGIGNIADGFMELTLGSALLIKNSVGVFLLLFLLVLFAAPVIKLFSMSVLLQGSGALMEVMADTKKLLSPRAIGEGIKMLMQVLLTAFLMLIISIAIVTFTTGGGA